MKPAWRRLTPLLMGLVLVGGCVAQPAPVSPVSSPAGVDGEALQQRIEDYIASQPAPLGNVRAVLVVVDGHTMLEYYRHGFTASDHEHVWSVTKSVISTLVGIAIGERQIPSLDSTLWDLLPEYRKVMTDGSDRHPASVDEPHQRARRRRLA